MPVILSTPVNTALIPSYFSYLPVRIHKEVAAIDAATFHAIETCAPIGSKERKQAIYRHTNPYGNPYALCHGECDIKKLEWFVKVVELIWIDDGKFFLDDSTNSSSLIRKYSLQTLQRNFRTPKPSTTMKSFARLFTLNLTTA